MNAVAAIAICMAAFEPDPQLFREQIESILAQTREDWVCLISDDCSQRDSFERMSAIVPDDRRFRLSRSPERLGFYLNFERALSMVPDGVELVALADQDDRWHPDKLQALSEALGAAPLVYSDARIVDREGRLIAASFWTSRRPRHTDFASLLVTNTVPGAASMFRHELLSTALPFPRAPGSPYHDHWLALVAAAQGEIAYVPEQLYDYVQHDAAVLGHAAASRSTGASAPAPRGERTPRRWRRAYLDEYGRVATFARALQLRCAPLAGNRRRTLTRLLAADRSPLGVLWLGWRWLRASLGGDEHGRGERTLLAAVAWRWLTRAKVIRSTPA